MTIILEEKLEKDFWEEAKNIGEIKLPPNYPVVKFFLSQKIECLKKFLDFNSICSDSDIGCGAGFSFYYFQSY